uniref:Uncharacterized protein EZY20 n=1 Tax=Chlamydomonas reinhardtii TaxID=3055 RepID=A2PZD1_CHLRE|nr:hypothetical protein [Chlamydomonas reinhardtii]
MGPLAALWALLVPALLGGVVASEVIPHVNECSLCFHCNVDAKPPPLLASDLVPANFQPRNVTHKQKLPICHTCRGCTVHLTLHGSSGQKKLFNTWFRDEVGASPSWLFVAPTDKTPNRKAIVKVACIPVGKHARHKFAQCHADLALKYAKIYLAIEKLAENCGLTDIIPKIWVDWVDAVIPEVGYHIRWLGLWMEMVEGISLENLVRLGNPMMHPDDLLDILHNRVNHTQTVRAALFDLLTSQNDRHAQNIFINGDGSIRLIDNSAPSLRTGTWPPTPSCCPPPRSTPSTSWRTPGSTSLPTGATRCPCAGPTWHCCLTTAATSRMDAWAARSRPTWPSVWPRSLDPARRRSWTSTACRTHTWRRRCTTGAGPSTSTASSTR